VGAAVSVGGSVFVNLFVSALAYGIVVAGSYLLIHRRIRLIAGIT